MPGLLRLVLIGFAVLAVKVGWHWGGQVLRERHLLVCRDWWRISAALQTIEGSALLLVWWLWLPKIGLVLLGLRAGAEAMHGARWLRGQSPCCPVKPCVGCGTDTLGGAGMTVCWWREARRHRDHDDDCKFGPRRHPVADALRRRLTWRKVALRPGLAPT